MNCSYYQVCLLGNKSNKSGVQLPMQTVIGHLSNVQTNVGLVYMRMHGINKQYQGWYQRTYPKYQNLNTSQMLLFGGYIKIRESLHTQLYIWVNTILNYIDTTVNLPRHENSCIEYRPERKSKTKLLSSGHTHAHQKVWNPHYTNAQMGLQEDDTRPTLIRYKRSRRTRSASVVAPNRSSSSSFFLCWYVIDRWNRGWPSCHNYSCSLNRIHSVSLCTLPHRFASTDSWNTAQRNITDSSRRLLERQLQLITALLSLGFNALQSFHPDATAWML
jgi:hypothetical protein